MQQKWNQNFDGEPMTDIPQKFLNAGCDVYMVMQLRHDEKILDERFASMRELHARPEHILSGVTGCCFRSPVTPVLLHIYPPFTFLTRRTAQMDELNPTVREQEIYEEMELTPEMIKSIRTLCATCLRHFVEAKAFKIALVPSADRSMDTCTVCQTRRGHDYVVMHR